MNMGSECKRRLIIGTLSVDDESKATLNTFGSDGRTIKERQLNYWIADETTLNISVEDNGDDGGTEITILYHNYGRLSDEVRRHIHSSGIYH
jgi:hypothetical protein